MLTPADVPVQRLVRFYRIALSTIILIATISQILVQVALFTGVAAQQAVIELGRQRIRVYVFIADTAQMLTDPTTIPKNLADIKTTDTDFVRIQHLAYVAKNLPASVVAQINTSKPSYDVIQATIQQILTLQVRSHAPPTTALNADLKTLLQAAPAYTQAYLLLYVRFEAYSTGQVNLVRLLEIILFGLLNTALLCEYLFVFRPATQDLKKALRSLHALQTLSQTP
jgi:hypothetical protein